MADTTITGILIDAALALFFVAGLAGAALGLILLLSPQGFARLNAAMSRRFSARRAMRPLEVPHYRESFFYRHHRWTGGLILAGALFFFFNLAFRFSPEAAAAVLPGVDWVWAGLLWFLILGNLVGAIIGLVILLRPSALKPLEAVANRWVSVRQAARPLDEPHDEADRLVLEYPRASGTLLLLAGLYLAATFGLLLAG
jgi:hypothetical protein